MGDEDAGCLPESPLDSAGKMYNRDTFFSTPYNPATYADSTTTHPRPTVIGIGLRMYILAQFSERTSFDWVQKVRAKTSKDEIKHADVAWVKAASHGDKELWRSVDLGIEAATIYVVDPSIYLQHVISELLANGAEYGYDFDARTALEMTAEQIVHDTPGYQLTNTRAALELASLTSPLGMMPPGLQPVICQPDLPIPREVLTKLGGGVRNAIRFAARAQSLFDAEMPDMLDLEAFPAFYAPGLRARLTEWRMRTAMSTPRIFDAEDSNSVEVLNETADWMSSAITGPSPLRPLVREADSARTDAIQAADIAAGAARDIIDRNGIRALAGKFRRIFVNGVDLHKVLRT
jgi:hypothetical protein